MAAATPNSMVKLSPQMVTNLKNELSKNASRNTNSVLSVASRKSKCEKLRTHLNQLAEGTQKNKLLEFVEGEEAKTGNLRFEKLQGEKTRSLVKSEADRVIDVLSRKLEKTLAGEVMSFSLRGYDRTVKIQVDCSDKPSAIKDKVAEAFDFNPDSMEWQLVVETGDGYQNINFDVVWKDQLPKDASYEIEVEGYKGNAMECALQREMVAQFWTDNDASVEGLQILMQNVGDHSTRPLKQVWEDDKFTKMRVDDNDECSSFRAWVTHAVVMQAGVTIDARDVSEQVWDRIVQHSHYKKVGGKPC